METDLTLSAAEGDLPAPFYNVGPVEWKCHGLHARLANYSKGGSQRYWVMYCPNNGSSLLSFYV
jgi:hypothetical protein